MKRFVLLLSRAVFGLVFMFSGFVKAVNPLGSMYKFEDYFISFGLTFFIPLSLVLAIALAAIEFVIGVNLLLGVQVKKTSWVALLFMAFMTPLTLYIALANPVSDCGCFGDALVIDNWTTFYKNIVLSLLVLIIFISRKKEPLYFSVKSQWLLAGFALLFSVGVSVYGYAHLPIFDFRPYKIGANIVEGMFIPDDAPQDVYETTFIYEKEGKQQAFTLENFPAGDSTWTFVDQQSKFIAQGFRPAIHDFSIEYAGDDITEEVLQDSGFTFLVVSSKLEKANEKDAPKINQLHQYAQDHGYAFYCITSSFGDAVRTHREQTDAIYPIAFADEVTLKTIIRSNPGIVLLKDGMVYNKWHGGSLPTFEATLENSDYREIQYPCNGLKLMGLLILFCLPVGGIWLLEKKNKK